MDKNCFTKELYISLYTYCSKLKKRQCILTKLERIRYIVSRKVKIAVCERAMNKVLTDVVYI